MPVPPKTPIRLVVRNASPASWGAVITGFACDYSYSDGDKEQVAAPYHTIDIKSGGVETRSAKKVKCVIKAHIAIRVEDQHGPHMIEKYLVESDFTEKCPDLHEATLGQAAPLAGRFNGVLGTDDVHDYSFVVLLPTRNP